MTGYKDVALLYRERGWAPIPAHGKRPVPAGATGKNGSVTDEKIADWMANGFRFREPGGENWVTQDPATANLALRHEGTVGIDVDNYGSKEGAAQLRALEAKLGPLPATPSSTSRGADSESRQHVYALREPVVLVGKAAPDIDIIQSHHRYTLTWPSLNPDADNAPYLWYDADGEPMDGPPHVDDLEYLPEAWLEYLQAAEAEYQHQSEQWEGDIPNVASAAEERKLRTIIARLDGLPDVWHEGAGWHDTVFSSACWLWRIARSNAYALTVDQAVQILLDHTPTYPQWGVDKIIEQWDSAEKSTAGQFEEPPLDTRPPLLEWHGFPLDRAFPLVDGDLFAGVWGRRPEKDDSGSLWAHRQKLLTTLIRGGFTDQEAATIVWHAAASSGVSTVTFGGIEFDNSDARAIDELELWREVDQAKLAVAKEQGSTVEAAPIDERPTYEVVKRIEFLTPEERARVESRECQWWGTRFIDWAQMTFDTVNLPYYRMNRWTVLSIIFAPKAVLPRPGGNDRPLNLYQAIVGTTTSGKSEALRVVKHINRAHFLLADTPDIGGNHTPESLVETLIAKDGEATWFHVDEAHTKIQQWKKPQGPYSEMPGVITDVYDGDVGAVYRATKKDISGKSAKAFMTAHLMGTPQGMADVMSPEDWESGFLNRFVWAIGDLPTEDDRADDYLDDSEIDEDTPEVASGMAMYQQWASEFGAAIQRISRPDNKPNRMKIPRPVIERHRQFKLALNAVATQNVAYTERLRPTFRRLRETIMRCAALVALSAGRIDITMDDLLIAIEQAEEWVANIITMVEATDESLRTRQVNAIEKAVIANGGVMALAAIHRLPRFKNRRREVEDFIAELVAQGRVDRSPVSGIDTVRLKGVTVG